MSKLKGPERGDKVIGYVRSNSRQCYSKHSLLQEHVIRAYADANGWKLVSVVKEQIKDKYGNILELPRLKGATHCCIKDNCWLVIPNLKQYRITDAFVRQRNIFKHEGGKEFLIEAEEVVSIFKSGPIIGNALTPNPPNGFIKFWSKKRDIHHHTVKIIIHYLTPLNDVGSPAFHGYKTVGDAFIELVREDYNDREIADFMNSINTVNANGTKWISKTVGNYREIWRRVNPRLLRRSMEEFIKDNDLPPNRYLSLPTR